MREKKSADAKMTQKININEHRAAPIWQTIQLRHLIKSLKTSKTENASVNALSTSRRKGQLKLSKRAAILPRRCGKTCLRVFIYLRGR